MKNPVLGVLSFLLDKIFFFVKPKPNCTSATDKNANVYETTDFKRGDLLEVPRTLFVHFGIYLGNNRVAHLIPDILSASMCKKTSAKKVVTNKRLIAGVLAKMASVRVDSVQDFAYGAIILVNEMDRHIKSNPLSNEEAAQRAEKLVGNTSYSLLWDNCEHFVTFCRYGTPMSLQTEKITQKVWLMADDSMLAVLSEKLSVYNWIKDQVLFSRGLNGSVIFQFCDTVKKFMRNQRNVLLSLAVILALILYFGMSLFNTISVFLFIFTLWMAS